MSRPRWKLEVALAKYADRWVITVRISFAR